MRVIAVVGIGADGWAGLGDEARAAILGAEEIIGSPRQLALLPPQSGAQDARLAVADGAAARRARDPCGGRRLRARQRRPDAPRHRRDARPAPRARTGSQVHPQPSAFALACARLGWAAAEVELVSAVARPPGGRRAARSRRGGGSSPT